MQVVVDIRNPLAELNQCIFNSANRLIISVIDVLCDGQCTDFADDVGKQTVGVLAAVVVLSISD